ncbi:MAG: amino acid racemase [Candidatus Peribacteraceae bacterium]|jgi:aspartate racemase|nr:amino acid racemase [Candidatus Peribacteraceae bacterium]|tara:strand:+ start:2607 stop:3317 length:711 start_codon:yes stop_codon:yes gene_type:complete
MKTLGVIGGMGPQASIRFMELVIGSCTKDFGVKENDEFPRILLSSLPAPDLISDRNREKQAGDMLEQEAITLEKAGADFLVMTCNTMHVLSPRITDSTSIPFISLIDTVVNQIKSDGAKKVGLLGSMTTMTSNLYLEPLRVAGVEVCTPGIDEKNEVVSCIMKVLAGDGSLEERSILKRVIENLQNQGAQSVILGCTELPLLISHSDVEIPVFDSLRLLANASCNEIFRGIMPPCV